MVQDLTIKEKFVQWLCPLIFFDGDKFSFPYALIMYDDQYTHIFTDVNYTTMKKKMKKMLKLLNNDHKIGYMDIETELWDKI